MPNLAKFSAQPICDLWCSKHG